MTAVNPIASLRRFAHLRAASIPDHPVQERCDLCGGAVSALHRHLFERAGRRLACVCDACAILFPRTRDSKLVLVPRRVRRLADFAITDSQWDSLGIPIGLAFFSREEVTRRIIAIYPSPAGSTETELPSESWEELARSNPILDSLEDDVETLLVNRTRNERAYYIAPIDRCYELAGTVRKHWRGLSGGTAVWDAIGRFFETLTRNGNA